MLSISYKYEYNTTTDTNTNTNANANANKLQMRIPPQGRQGFQYDTNNKTLPLHYHINETQLNNP